MPTDCLCIHCNRPTDIRQTVSGHRAIDPHEHICIFLMRFRRSWMPIPSIWMWCFSRPVMARVGTTISTAPWTKPAYNAFYEAMLAAEKVQPKEFEKIAYFESCIPIEVMAERGRQTMQFGPLKPVGLGESQDRCASLCCGSAPDGKCPSVLLQHRGISDQTDLSGSRSGCFV